MGEVIRLSVYGGTVDGPAARLRDLRHLTGMSPGEFAAAIADEAGEPVPMSVYMAYEDGETPPAAILSAARRVMADTGDPVAALGQQQTMTPTTLSRVKNHMDSDGVTVPCRSAAGRIIWVTVPRRTFLFGGVAATAGLAMRPTGRLSATQIASDGDLSPVEHLQHMRRVLIDADNLFGPRHIIPTAHDHIRIIKQLRVGRSGADRNALLHLQAEFAEFVGWLHQDSGDFSQAQFWLDRALDWAHAVADPEMATYVMARKSQLAGDMRDLDSAIDLADAAIAIAPPKSRLRAVAHTYKAHGLALAHESKAAALALDTAHTIATAPDNQDSSWAAWLDEAYIDVQRGRCLSLLGSHKQAAGVFQSAIRGLPSSFHRDRGVYLAREAQAHAGARAPEQAAATAMLALDVAEGTGSGRIVAELATLDAQLEPWARVPAVADFRQALTNVIPQQTDRHQ